MIALAAGVALGPEGAGGAGALCIGVGLLGAAGAVRAGARRPPRRSAEGRSVRRRLGAQLIALEDRGWLVSESVAAGDRGRIDFLVTSPAVSFVIDIGEAGAAMRLGGHKAWARDRYGPGRQIEAVLCSHRTDGPVAPLVGARRIPPSGLVPFLLDRG